MEETLIRLRNRFLTLPKDLLRKIYYCQLKTMKVFTCLKVPEDVQWIIEAKAQLASEIRESFIRSMSEMGRSSYSKKKIAKRMGVCHKCAKWSCNKRYRSKGMIAINQEDKIHFIKDRLSKESLDDIIQALETHLSGDVHRILLDLVKLFNKEKECYSLGTITLKDLVY